MSACCFVFFRPACLLRVVFLVVGTKQSNQIGFVSDASQCGHSAHTMGKFISLRQQFVRVIYEHAGLRAERLGMLMGFG